MNVSFSAQVEDLNTTVVGFQSAISIYALVKAAFTLSGGKLSDIFGKKRVLIVGLFIDNICTIQASCSANVTMLLVDWSSLAGIGCALMIPDIQMILRDQYE